MSKILELHFNPKDKGTISDSFCYRPENIYERRLGDLYTAGQLSNALPQNYEILGELSKFLKKEFYSKSSSPEMALKEALKKANGYLSEKVKKGNVGWLGNLDFAILNIKDLILCLTKAGNIKILIVRSGISLPKKIKSGRGLSLKPERSSVYEILDIGKNLDLEGLEPYPLKIFSNIAVGKLSPSDKIIILTKDVFGFFAEKKLIRGLAAASDDKEIMKLLHPQEKELKCLSGILLFIALEEKLRSPATRNLSRELVFQKETPPLWDNIKRRSLFKIAPGDFTRLISFAQKVFYNLFSRISTATLGLWSDIKKRNPALDRLFRDKNFRLLLILILVLILGFYLFKNK